MNDPVTTTIASYEAKANEYIQNTDQLSYFPDLPAMLDKFIALLPGKKVLDVAFGSGRDTFYLSEHGLSVQGIELTQSFIDSLREKAKNPISKMDMRWLGFADNVFDGIWCCAAFLHIPRSQTIMTLNGFSRVLRPCSLA
ncbi:MAG: class I SAM-dependent methyltransferase [Anaerolineae bacterium]